MQSAMHISTPFPPRPFSLRETALELFEEAQFKKRGSRFEKFKSDWKRDSKKRLVLGLTLAGWAIIATATGATAIAGAMLATRAAVGAIGGFLTTEALFDIGKSKLSQSQIDQLLATIERADDFNDVLKTIAEIEQFYASEHLESAFREAQRKKVRFEAVKKVSAVTVAAVLGVLGGSHAAEAATESVSQSATPIVPVPTSTSVSANLPPIAPHNPPPSMKDIFADIRHDHPTQRYVTLEQSIRRIEGLKQGITLEESEKLTTLNNEISRLVHNPNGHIATIIDELGYRSPGETIDQAARKLQEKDLQEILEKYIEQTTPTATPTPTDIISPVAPQSTPASNSTIELDSARLTTETPQDDLEQKSWYHHAFGKILIGWTALLSAFGIGRMSKKDDATTVTPTQETTTNPVVIPPIVEEPSESTVNTVVQPPVTQATENDAAQNIVDDTLQTTSVHNNTTEHEHAANEPEEISIEQHVRDLMNTGKHYQWLLDREKTRASSEKAHVCFRAPTLWGEFEMRFEITHTSYHFAVIWHEAGIGRHHVDSGKIESSTIPRDLTERSVFLQELIEKYFFEILDYREEQKTMEMRSLHTVEITKQDLKAIYQQLEHPETVALDHETGGWWYMDSYRLHNGKIRMINLHNPPYELIDASPVIFKVKSTETGMKYDHVREVDYMKANYSYIETKWMIERREEDLEVTPRAWFKTGMVSGFNWHKHCSETLRHPSGGDINDPACATLAFNKSNVQAHTWAILTPLTDPHFRPESHQVILGEPWQRRYVLSYWALNRNPQNIHGRYTHRDLRKINVEVVD